MRMKPGTVTFRHLWWTARGGAALAAALVAVLALSGPAWAADGDLDTSFGDDFASDGTRDGFRLQNRTKLKDELRSLAFRSDGTFVAGGFDDNNGSIDEAQRMAWASLGTNGVGNGGFSNPNDRQHWSPKTDSVEEVLLLSDGRTAMVGYAGTHTTNANKDYDCVAMMRDTDTTLDSSFSGNGKKFVQFSAANNDRCYCLLYTSPSPRD